VNPSAPLSFNVTLTFGVNLITKAEGSSNVQLEDGIFWKQSCNSLAKFVLPFAFLCPHVSKFYQNSTSSSHVLAGYCSRMRRIFL
jgi:hypothetical protein